MTLVSVVVPVFNRSDFLYETIESVINQTYSNWELLLVDDGSTDGSIDICRQYQQKDIRITFILRDRQPKGAPVCRNIGIENASGDFVIFLDSDDLLAPYCLEQRVSIFNDFPKNDFIVLPMFILDEKINKSLKLTNIDTEESDLHRFLRSDVVWQTSQPIWKRKSILDLKGFDENFPNCQDHELHLRALFTGLVYTKFYDAKPDAYYRKHDKTKIYQPKNPLKVLKGINILLNKLSEKFARNISNDHLAQENLSIFLFDVCRLYTRNNSFEEPQRLANTMFKSKVIMKKSFLKIRLYIFFSSLGMRNIRGYERFWNFIISRKSYPMTWGKMLYQGDL